ncbi:hypothetical protein L596_023334 [Steinernema carpocapsae]|uniref:LRRCT domain-containing protein n=1 Tax=Steinernema carpocapsae TaxID=34508 RepID=A0A4U5ME37_STECR|nr:hypothetical protein L596_023334 [Steinernema carpocapsae]
MHLILLLLAASVALATATFLDPTSHTICDYCLCDKSSAAVTCSGSTHIILRTVVLPSWAESLYVHNITMRHLPRFSFHSGLRVLRINFCQLNHLHPYSLVSLPNLETLHLADNHIEELPGEILRRLTQLRILNLARNRIADVSSLDLDLAEGVRLEQLNLDGNPLAVVTKPVLWPAVEQLHMANTNLHFMNKTHLVFAASFDCSEDDRCRAIQITPDQWTNLHSIDFSNNPNLKVHSSALEMMTPIISLNLAGAILSNEFPNWLHTKSAARHANISDVRLQISDHEWTFCGERLEWLDINGIGLAHLEIWGDCNLKWLFASRNNLTSVTLRSSVLENVYLDENHLVDWPFPPPGVALSQLETLSLAQNHLIVLPDHALSPFPKLQYLDVSGNNISIVASSAFPSVGMQLRSVNISRNHLETFVHPVLPSLMVLDLSHNNLKGLDPLLMAGLPLLQHLHLSNNPKLFSKCHKHDFEGCWIAAIDQLTSLVELDLSNSSLSRPVNLSAFTNLRTIDLSNNGMSSFNARLLPPCVAHLNLKNNLLHYVSNFTTPTLSCLHEIDVADNPLVCDCSLSPISHLLVTLPHIEDRSHYYCFASNWQHPLLPYLSNIHSCSPTSLDNLIPMFVNFALFLIAFGILIIVGTFLMSKFLVIRLLKVPFLYKPLSTAEPMAEL